MTTFELTATATPGLYDQDLGRFRSTTKVAAVKSPSRFVEKRATVKFDAREKIAEIILTGDGPAANELRAMVCVAFAKTAAVSSHLRARQLQKEARDLRARADAEGWDDARLEKEAAEFLEKLALYQVAGRVIGGIGRALAGAGGLFGGSMEIAGRKGIGAGLRHFGRAFRGGPMGEAAARDVVRGAAGSQAELAALKAAPRKALGERIPKALEGSLPEEVAGIDKARKARLEPALKARQRAHEARAAEPKVNPMSQKSVGEEHFGKRNPQTGEIEGGPGTLAKGLALGGPLLGGGFAVHKATRPLESPNEMASGVGRFTQPYQYM
jgi:hypothetical protein